MIHSYVPELKAGPGMVCPRCESELFRVHASGFSCFLCGLMWHDKRLLLYKNIAKLNKRLAYLWKFGGENG